jgi:hypothetical protein
MKKQEYDRVLCVSSHPIKGILSSRQPAMVLLKYIFLLSVTIMSLLGLKFILRSLQNPFIFRKDFLQEYLLARAVLDGVNPYLSLPELAQRFMISVPNWGLQHPTPHPPPVILISLPLGLLSYENAAVVWFLFEILCFGAGVYFLLHWLHERSGFVITAVTILLIFAWGPLQDELALGQLMALMLVILIGVWKALRSGNHIRGGVLLGCSIALKLIAWPIIVFLLFRKNWRAVIATGITLITANFGVALIIGVDRVLHYYLKVGKTVTPLYRAYSGNFSIFTIGWRLFEGTGSPVLFGLEAPPLVAAPDVAPYVSIAVSLAVLVVGFTMALRTKSFDISFGIMVCMCLLVTPVTWSHYLILTLIPIAITGRYLFDLDLPKKETWIFLVISLILFLPRLDPRWFIMGHEIKEKSTQVPFVAAILTFIPAVTLIGLMWLLRSLNPIYPSKRYNQDAT